MAAIDVETMEVVEMSGTGNTPHPGSGAVWELTADSSERPYMPEKAW